MAALIMAGDECVHLVKGHGVDVDVLALLTLSDQLIGRRIKII